MRRTTTDPPVPTPPAPQRRASFRREVALAAVVVVIYGVVFGSSLFTLLGGEGAPDFLRLKKDAPQQTATEAEVLSAQSADRPPATTPTQQPAAAPESKPAPAEAAAPQPSPAAEPAAATTLPAASVSGQHLVRSGDTLSQLSLVYSVDIGALKLINGLTSDVIYIGQTLTVPRPLEASTIGVPSLGEGPGDTPPTEDGGP